MLPPIILFTNISKIAEIPKCQWRSKRKRKKTRQITECIDLRANPNTACGIIFAEAFHNFLCNEKDKNLQQ